MQNFSHITKFSPLPASGNRAARAENTRRQASPANAGGHDAMRKTVQACGLRRQCVSGRGGGASVSADASNNRQPAVAVESVKVV
jgi:hypothetical protein